MNTQSENVVSERVSTVLHSTQYSVDRFGDETFQAIYCTSFDNQTHDNKKKRQNQL